MRAVTTTTRRAALVMAILAAPALAACGAGDHVLRVVNGRVVEGEFVEGEAYTAFLRGAIAEAGGDTKAALAAYHEAARSDSSDPEVWTRIGDLRCRSEAGRPDRDADAALDRALSIDDAYAPAWDARARCAMARGDTTKAAEAARRGIAGDPMAVESEALLARALRAPAARAEWEDRRLVALTMLHGDRVEAWDALAAWGASHGERGLWGVALEKVAVLAPSRRASLALTARTLEGAGESAMARALAGTLVDAGWSGDRKSAAFALVARLAIDAALVSGDAELARLRAVRVHVGLDVVAARALLLGDAALARAIAEPVVAADPSSAAARVVLAVAAAERDEAAVARALGSIALPAEALPSEALLAFIRVLARVTTRDAALAFVARAVHAPLLPHDSLTTSLAVDLVARGILDPRALPPDGLIELAARRGDAPPASALPAPPSHDGASVAVDPPVASAPDARHALLALALIDPRAARTATLAQKLAPAADRDPIVAVAMVRLAIAGAAPRRDDALARFDPADPLIAAAAYDLAVHDGNARAIPSARARLAAVARTPAERARIE